MKSFTQMLEYKQVLALAALALGCSIATLGVAPPSYAPVLHPVRYAQPAEHASVGVVPLMPGISVLPSGRLTSPVGLHQSLLGTVMASALDPSGRWLVLAFRQLGRAQVGIYDAKTLHEVHTLVLPTTTLGGGLVVLPDPAHPQQSLIILSTGGSAGLVWLDLAQDGNVSLDPQPLSMLSSEARSHFSGMLIAGPQPNTVLVLDEILGTIGKIDVKQRKKVSETAVGLAPHGLLALGRSVLVTNEGLENPSPLNPVAPEYPAPIFDLGRASSLNILSDAPRSGFAVSPVPLDPTPHGLIVGGAHPTAVVGAGNIAYVALSAVDRIATVNVANKRVIGGSELRFFDRGPYGMQPVALALDQKRARLYVALAGANAVAVLDVQQPATPHRLGLIPTGSLPTGVFLNQDASALYVVSARGFGPTPSSVVQRVSVLHLDLPSLTRTSLRNLRRVVQPAAFGRAERVVQIRMPAASFDEIFGSRAPFDATVMPELHRLAHHYYLATNFYSQATGGLSAEQLALAGEIMPYTARTEAEGAAHRWEGTSLQLGPDDAPRYGYIFDALARAKVPFRSYGALTAMNRYNRASDGLYAAALVSGRPSACATEFVRDHAATPQARFIEIELPDVLLGDPGVAATETDTALKTMLSALERDPQWSKTVVIISPWRTDGSMDHIDPQHTYAVFVDPSGPKAVLSRTHRSIASLVKTEELLLGVPAMTLGDLLASPIDGLLAGDSGSNG